MVTRKVKMRRIEFGRAFLKSSTIDPQSAPDKGVLDEIPGAYKDIKQVMRNQKDLVKIVAEIKQVVCVKG
jgi:tRNA-splicing ligase RtcB